MVFGSELRSREVSFKFCMTFLALVNRILNSGSLRFGHFLTNSIAPVVRK